MRELLLKDLSLLVGGYRWVILAIPGFFTLMWAEDLHHYAYTGYIVGAGISLFCMLTDQSPEINRMVLQFPIARKRIVQAKYVLPILSGLLGIGVSSVLQLVSLLNHPEKQFSAVTGSEMAVIVSLIVLQAAFYYPFFLGQWKRVANVVLSILLFFNFLPIMGIGMFEKIFGEFELSLLYSFRFLGASLFVYLLSYLLTQRLFQHTDY